MLVFGCASRSDSLQPFTSDGCSMFPERALVGNKDWCDCCVAHDLAYWKGGTQQDRLAADRELERCVRASTSDAALAASMLAGVRVGGSPYLNTPFRWAYGWPADRNYRALTDDELALAASLETAYRAERAEVCKK